MRMSRFSGVLGGVVLGFLIVLVSGCDRTAALKGVLELKPGENGDVRGSTVILFAGPDTAPEVAFETTSEVTAEAFRSPFAFTELEEGVYYIVAWKDIDEDGDITDGDLVGVAGGEYDSTDLGEQVGVVGGLDTDAGVIEMQPYLLLTIAASGSRDDSLMSTSFSYSFNRDVVLRSLTIDFPRFGVYADPAAPGSKQAGVSYRSDDWSFGSEMPDGQHLLVFKGVWDGKWFDIDVPVVVE